MDGEWSFHIILEEKGVEGEGEVVVALEALIWSATSAVSLVILLVNAECVEVQVLENVEVVALLDIEGVQAMVAGQKRTFQIYSRTWYSLLHLHNVLFETGVIVPVDDPPDAEAYHLVDAAIADLHTVAEMKFLIPMGEITNFGIIYSVSLLIGHSFLWCSYMIKVGCF